MKKHLLLHLCSLFLLLTLFSAAFAEDSYTSPRKVYLNPVYESIFTEQDVLDNEQPALLRMASAGSSSSPVTSWEELGILLRQQLTRFSPSITLYLYSDISGSEAVFAKMREAYELAAMHTGVPNEGDYIRWNNMGYSYGYTRYSSGNSDYSYKYELNYKFSYLHNSSQETATTNALNKAYATLSFADSSAYSKTLAIYNYVIDHVEYDYKHLSDSSYILKHSTYAAAVNGLAVCQGYASMMYRMLLMAGVGNRMVTSNTHAWNIVQIGDTYYQTDATWGDSSYQSTRNKYFLKKGGAWTDSDHIFESRYLTDEFMEEFPISTGDYIYYPITSAEICDSTGIALEDINYLDYSAGSTVLYALVDPVIYERNIVWSTPNAEIITLVPSSDSLSCTVEFHQKGTASVTIQTINPEWSDTVDLNIVTPAETLRILNASGDPAEGMNLDISEVEQLTLSAAAEPADAGQIFAWESSNTAVARVSSDKGTGTNVTLRSVGTAMITASTLDGTGISESVELTVTGDNGKLGVTAITVIAPEAITVGRSDTVSAVVYPETAYNKAVTWSVAVNGRASSLATVRNSVLTLNKNVAAGSIITVTAAAADGSGVTGSANILAAPKVSKLQITDLSDQLVSGTRTLILNESREFGLKAGVIPETASPDVTWKTSNKSIAVVNEAGLVTFQKPGTVTVTATAKDGSGKSASVKLTGKSYVESISLSGPEKIALGKTGTVTAVISPADAGNKKLKWSVSIDGAATKLATVSSGKLKINKKVPAGTVLTVKAESTDGSDVFGTVDITASPVPSSILILDSEGETLPAKKTVALNDSNIIDLYALAVSNSEEEVSQEFTWRSSAPKVASVDNGQVTFLKDGTTTVTAAAKDGSGKSRSVKLTGKTYVTEITVSAPETILPGKSAAVSVSVSPANAGNKSVTWTVLLDGQTSKLVSVSKGKLVINKKVSEGSVVTLRAKAADNYLYNGSYVTGEATVTVGSVNGPAIVQELAAALPEPAETSELPSEEFPAPEEVIAAETVSAENAVSTDPAEPFLVEAAAGESIDLSALVEINEELIWAASDTDSAIVENGTAHISPDAEPGTEIIVMAASANDPDNAFRFTIRVIASTEETPESDEGNGRTEETGVIESEEPAETGTPEILPSISFDEGELNLTAGESRQLTIVSEEDLFFGSSNNEIVAADPETGIITAISAGETMIYAASAEPFEIRAMLHVTVTTPAAAEISDEIPADGPELLSETETPENIEAEDSEPEAEALTAPSAEEEPAESGAEEDTEATDANTEAIPAEPEKLTDETPTAETPSEPDPILTELSIEEIDESGITAAEGSLLTIERRRFSAPDEALSDLTFRIENETVARLTERTPEDILEKGIEISLLSAGETRLLIGFDGEEPLLKVRISVNTPAAEEISEQEPLYTESTFPESEPELVLQQEPEPEAAAEEPMNEPVYEQPEEQDDFHEEPVVEEAAPEPEPEPDEDVPENTGDLEEE